jgi:hypothetical protein
MTGTGCSAQVGFFRRRVTADTEDVARRERRSLLPVRASGTSLSSAALLTAAKFARALLGVGMGAGTATGRVRCDVLPACVQPGAQPSVEQLKGMKWPGCEV